MELDKTIKQVLEQIDPLGFEQKGAYNLRYNGTALCHGDSDHIKIKKKEDKQDKQGIDIYISKEAQGEYVHIPVVITASGMNDLVYNDFYIEAGAHVNIIAGCGIHNSGCNEARHDGIHSFHVGKNAIVTYAEKHYGEGEGTGENILNPVTNIYMEEDSMFSMDTEQIKGVDSTKRETKAVMAAGAKLYMIEKLMTHDNQYADTIMNVYMKGANSSSQIISRSVAKGESKQVFHPNAVGEAKCHAHIQCDAIIMDKAEVCAIPEIIAKNIDAEIIHEAAIGRINSEQLLKLQTFGMTEEEAEAVIIESFLN